MTASPGDADAEGPAVDSFNSDDAATAAAAAAAAAPLPVELRPSSSLRECVFPLFVRLQSVRASDGAAVPDAAIDSELCFEAAPLGAGSSAAAGDAQPEYEALLRIGRGPAGPACHVACPFSSVSRAHCEVRVRFRLHPHHAQAPEGASAGAASRSAPRRRAGIAGGAQRKGISDLPTGEIRACTVSDVGSLNGTLLGDVRLLPCHHYHITRWPMVTHVAEGGALERDVPTPCRGAGRTTAARGKRKRQSASETAEVRAVAAALDAPQRLQLQIQVSDNAALRITVAMPRAGPAPADPKVVAAPSTPPACDASVASDSAGGPRVLSPRRRVARIISSGVSTSSAKTQNSERTAGCVTPTSPTSPILTTVGTSPPQHPARFPSVAGLVVVTTGVRLTDDMQRAAKRLGVVINPPFEVLRRSAPPVLVAEPQLQRSVKLLCALPHVRSAVRRQWLDRLLTSGTLCEVTDSDTYRETRTRHSIESVNDFSLSDTLGNFTPQQRRALFSGRAFWVHPRAQPQEPPDNDIKAVIEHSGGKCVAEPGFADVVVVPTRTGHAPTVSRLIERLSRGGNGAAATIVCPDDIFVAVLRQGSIRSTVEAACPSAMPTAPREADSHKRKRK